jgi:membrane associated rhomboid family serine protease
MEQPTEQSTEVRSLVEQGDALLLEDKAAEAAAVYTRAVEADPSAVKAHLGLAKAYLALGAFGYIYMACQQVQRLAPGSADASLAQAILFTLDHRYDAAIHELDRVEKLSPGQPYVHALRGYCYRRLGNSYDAMSAESKAARLSGVREWKHLFPQEPVLKPVPEPAENAAAFPGVNQNGAQVPAAPQAPRSWDQRSEMQRRMVQARFATRNVPIVTYSLIAINVLIYVLMVATGGSFLDTTGSAIFQFGAQQGSLIEHDPTQVYRIVTAMFLHEGILHILFNMLSLYFIGIWVEQIFGKSRFLIIYFVGGIIAGLTQALVTPTIPSLGASGAIFAIFGAFGAYFLLRRRAMGPAGNAIIGQWIFWLAFNLWFSFSQPGIGVWDHIGGLIAGFVLGILFTNMTIAQRRH